MDLRVLVLTGDTGLAELLRAQVENLGCPCSLVDSYDEASATLGWADAAIVDLAGDGLDDLSRLRVEAPRLRVLAIAPDEALAAAARSAGADQVLVEPFVVAEVVDAVRHLGPQPVTEVVDLRSGEQPVVVEDAPWWATR